MKLFVVDHASIVGFLCELLRTDFYGCSAIFFNLVCRLFFDCVKKSKTYFNISDDKTQDTDDENWVFVETETLAQAKEKRLYGDFSN